MPGDNSSSVSEDEDGSSPAPSKATRASRYQCPEDFVSFCHKPCGSTLTESLKNSNRELWLIKAPASFKPDRFSGVKVPLSGLQTLRVSTDSVERNRGSAHPIYSAFASTQGTSDLHLLTTHSESSGDVAFGPAFSGLLNVCESYGDSSTNQAPQSIPATPAPSIPAGLKQRFYPFGSKTPTQSGVARSKAEGQIPGTSSTTPCPTAVTQLKEEEKEEGQERKSKKKKKKDKRKTTEFEFGETEGDGGVTVEGESVLETPLGNDLQEGLVFQEENVSEERRKRKKRKGDNEKEEVMVKCEPMDMSYEELQGSVKKKKKKKKSKNSED